MGGLCELEIQDSPEFSPVISISWIENLRRVTVKRVKLLEEFEYSKSSYGVELEIRGKGDLHGLDQVLVFDKETSLEKLTLERCPPLELKHLLMLTSLKTLMVRHSESLVGPLGGQGDVEWQLPVEHMEVNSLNGNSGKELTELLPHLPRLSKLEITMCENIKQLVVGVDLRQKTSATSEMEEEEITAAEEKEDDGVLLFPSRLCGSLRELDIYFCKELVLVDPPTLILGGGGLQALRSLQRLSIKYSQKFLSCCVEGMGTLEPLSKLSSLVTLQLSGCGRDLKCQGLRSLLTTGGQLNKLSVFGSPRFFACWDPNPRWALEDVEGGKKQQTHLASSTLQVLSIDDVEGLLVAPICSFLSSSLTKLELGGSWSKRLELFSKEQEDALQLLSSLQKLEFSRFDNLQQLPAGLCNLTSLKVLSIKYCSAISSLPKGGLPKSLQLLDVSLCKNQKLTQQCRGLEGTISKIILPDSGSWFQRMVYESASTFVGLPSFHTHTLATCMT